MKYVAFSLLTWFFAAFSYKAMAQDDKGKKSETEEVIIRNKGDKDATITLQFSGDQVLINGKPLIEFKDDGITINKRKIIVKDKDNFRFEGFDMEDFPFAGSADGKMETSRTFLGVVTEESKGGVKINSVTPGSAADKAGLKAGDVITKFEGKSIATPQALYEAVTAKKANEVVKINYDRDGKGKSTKATLQEKKETTMSFSMRTPEGGRTFVVPRAPRAPRAPGAPGAPGSPSWEMELEKLRDLEGMNFGENFMFSRGQKLGLKIQDTEESNGVKVLEVEEGSAGEKAGIKKDDVVTEIAGKPVTNTDEAREILAENKDKSTYTIKAKRAGSIMSFDVKIPKKLKTANL